MAEQMKPRGIDWIGDIPINWKCSKAKFCFSLVNGSTPDSSDYDCWDGDIRWITPADMSDTGTISQGERFITKYGYNSCGTTLLPAGSIVVSSRAPIGKINITTAELCTNQGCKSLIRTADNRYFYYLFLAGQNELSLLGRGTTFLELSTYDLNEFGIVIPAEDEQKAIADFLDKECAQIDSIAADLEKQITLLQQYKKSLITETVTKGLDKSVPMKDSSIEGIGKVPSHWKVNRLKYAAAVKTGPFGTQLSASEYSDEGIPVINVKNIGYGTIIEDNLDYVPDEVCQRLAQHQLQLGDIVFGRKGAVDKHAIITESQIGWVQGSDCIRVRIDGDIDSRYLNYLFDTVYFAEYVLLYAVGTTMASINSDILTNSRILVPPITEQRCIADFLDSNCKTLFEIIENKQSQLATLQQHKKSLIYEYVTGKKRVKEVL